MNRNHHDEHNKCLKQSPNDFNKYQPITLKNGLRVLLVHNKDSVKSAAALVVNAGHFNDPIERQGLAHFLEHMLFLGTEKYPDGSEYQKFINHNGGSNNAWTATEHTSFFFDIPACHFEQTLERFSQFFISPLLSQDFIDKERKNVDAEYKLKLKDDIRRLYDVHKETINQEHPFAKFSVGNTDTLADHEDSSIQAELQAFYHRYYCAQYMTIVLEGPQPLELLSDYATTYFSEIYSSNASLAKVTQPLYRKENLQKIIHVQPVKNDKQLIISFALPSIDPYYLTKPESVLSYLIGHEGKGSILSLLKQKQWAIGLTAGGGINGSNFKDFNISIALTDLGSSCTDDVIKVVFQYLQLIGKAPLSEHYYEEKKAIADLSFMYQEKQSALDNACQLAINMQHYPEADYIYGDYSMQSFSQDQLTELLSQFSLDNMRIIHIDQRLSFDRISKWYRVPFQVNNITEKQLKLWGASIKNKALFLPDKNPYIVSEPSVVESEELASSPISVPRLIKKENGLKVWFKQDRTFKVPKGYIYVGMDSPTTIANVTNIAMSKLFVDIYSDAIVEEHYDAELAGIHYQIYAHQSGLSLQVSGLSENQGKLLSQLLLSLKNVTFTESQFTLQKEQLLNHWKNSDKNKSISQLFSTLSSALQPANPGADALFTALKPVSYNVFIEYAKTVTQNAALEVLIHGNWQEQDALKISHIITDVLAANVDDANFIDVQLRNIEQQGELSLPVIMPEHDHACVIYYPLAKKEPREIALTILLTQLLSPAFFQKMRTEKQYGYLVGVGYVPIQNFPGIAFYIQSPMTCSIDLYKEIDLFINDCLKLLTEVSAHEWLHLQKGLAGQLKEKDSTLHSRSQRFWGAICNKDTNFNHKQRLIKEVMALTMDNLRAFINETLLTAARPDRINLLSFSNNKDKAECLIPGQVFDDKNINGLKIR